MLVFDRTLSMCWDTYGNTDPSCTDLNNAREGMRTFLGYLDPGIHWVGLGVFPPAPAGGSGCSTPKNLVLQLGRLAVRERSAVERLQG